MKFIWHYLAYSLFGSVLVASGIAGFVLALLYLKCAAGGLTAFVAIVVTAFGIFDIVVTHQVRHRLDHWMD